jgi:F-type H+-transporting ATPase subunit b
VLLAENVESGLLNINASFWIELVAFLIMLGILARYVYPRIISAAEARQRAVAAELEAAETARQDAQHELEEARTRLEDARAQAQDVIAGANKSADQLRAEQRQRAEEEGNRLIERARQEIEAERQKALDSVRGEVASLVVEATQRVVGETLDASKHRRLIDEAIEEVGANRG